MTTNEKVLIKVENLQKSFEDNKVLDGISTEIRQGEVVAVIGPSGSGKSTFLRSLNRLEIPTGGKIYFEGVDITAPETDIDHVRQKIGMVFQQFNLFPHKTVKENILLAPVTLKLMTPEEAEKKAMELPPASRGCSSINSAAMWRSCAPALLCWKRKHSCRCWGSCPT